MVAFPDSEIEPTLINSTSLTSKDSNKISDDSPREKNVRRIKDEAFTMPRVTMPNDKDGYALKFDSINKINDKLSVNINQEPVFVQKVAGKKSHEINTVEINVCAHRFSHVTIFMRLNVNPKSLATLTSKD